MRRCARDRSSAGLLTVSDGGGSDLAVVVSERFWKDRLNGGESIAGRTLSLNGSLFSIVGVLPEGFQGPGGLYEPDLWLPLEKLPLLGLSPTLTDRQTPVAHRCRTIEARRHRGAGAGRPARDHEQLAQAHPSTNTGRSVSFLPVSERRAGAAADRAACLGRARGRRHRPADRVLQRRGAAARARRGAAARDRGAHRARRDAGDGSSGNW